MPYLPQVALLLEGINEISAVEDALRYVATAIEFEDLGVDEGWTDPQVDALYRVRSKLSRLE